MKAYQLFPLTLLVFTACIYQPGNESATGTTGEQFKNNKMISITFEADSEIVSRLVPEQIRIPESKQFAINIGIYNRINGPKYYMMIIEVPAMINGKVSSYLPLTFVDSSEAAKQGYIDGMISMPAKFEIELGKNKFNYRISDDETTIINAEYTMFKPYEKVEKIKEKRYANSFDSGKVKEVVVTDFVMTKAATVNGSFTLNLPPPLDDISISMKNYAFYFECNFNMRESIN